MNERHCIESSPERNLFIKPVGDAVMTYAVLQELRKDGYDGKLCMPGWLAPMFLHADSNAPVYASNELGHAVDVVSYLDGYPHTHAIPLVTAIGRHVSRELQLPDPKVRPEAVQLPVTAEDISHGTSLLESALSPDDRKKGKPIITVHPSAGSKNREIPADVMEEALGMLSQDASPVFIGNLPKGYERFEGKIPLLKTQIAELAGVLGASSAFLTAESGPLHVAAAVMQSQEGQRLGLSTKRIIGVFGSSNPICSYYPGMELVLPDNSCPLANKCGFHGYSLPDQTLQGKNSLFYFYPEHEEPGKREACISEDYPKTGIAPCMASMWPDEIAGAVRRAINTKQDSF